MRLSIRSLVIVCSVALLTATATPWTSGGSAGVPKPDPGGWWNVVEDGSLESGGLNTPWDDYSDFSGGGSVFADDAALAWDGQWFAVFGSSTVGNGTAFLSQVTEPFGTADAVLRFQLQTVQASGTNEDTFHVSIDGVPVWETNGAVAQPGNVYELIEVPIGQYADGAPHELTFNYVATSGATWACMFYVDGIEIMTRNAPSADFSWAPASPEMGDTVQFTDLSTGEPTSWIWDFGDGTQSTQQNPSHIYAAADYYTVSLTVHRASDGATDTAEAEVIVSEPTPELIADFSWEPPSPQLGDPVQFTDLTAGEPDTWSWEFGDGGQSEERHPLHAYSDPGTYTVSLTVHDYSAVMSDTAVAQITVEEPTEDPVADFTWQPQSPHPGEPVQFTDLSTGDIESWSWSFGDGEGSSEPNPMHTYAEPGSYEVSLHIAGVTGAGSTATHTVDVVGGAGWADFTWQPPAPAVGQAVEFFPEVPVGCDPTSWSWSFGDGGASAEEIPVHVFGAPGAFEVTLTVGFSGTAGCGEQATVTKTVTVSETDLTANFIYWPGSPQALHPVFFADTSAGQPEHWFWEFGDGETSTEPEPVHAYQVVGTYDVTLTVSRGADQQQTDSVTYPVEVVEPLAVDFSWAPEDPTAWSPVQLTLEADLDMQEVYWDFGDGHGSQDIDPSHVYLEPGTYLVAVWVHTTDGTLAHAEHEIEIAPAEHDVQLQVSNHTPMIGESVQLTLIGAPTPMSVTWDLRDINCDGDPPMFTCTPSSASDCFSVSWTYSNPGVKVPRCWITIADYEIGPFAAMLDVGPEGSCNAAPLADFEWWPVSPVVGEPVQFADLSTGPPDDWAWTFGDGGSSDLQHPEHVFQDGGTYNVMLAVDNTNGTDSATRTLTVAEDSGACGDGVCGPGESSWSCPEDCGAGTDATGRTGGKETQLFVPAAASGVRGLNNTLWFTEGMLFNPGQQAADVVAAFTPADAPSAARVAGPLRLPARAGVYFEDLVADVFGTTGLGSLRLSADHPIIIDTRTFNSTDTGTLGQGIGGIPRRETLGAQDGKVFLLGLKETLRFRTNLLLQEVTGQPAVVSVRFHDRTGAVVATNDSVAVPGYGRRQLRLADLGYGFRGHGYASLEVAGLGRIAAIGSIIDQQTGDATTIDAIHPKQVAASTATGGSKSSVPIEPAGHFLVAVIARTPGLNETVWRSEANILNTNETQTQNLDLYYFPSGGTMHHAEVTLEPGQEFSSNDVVGQLFSDAGDGAGALHVVSPYGVGVNTRTYNVVDEQSGATVGQAIPGLASGDLIQPGESWVLNSLKSTEEFRCNIGFSEYQGNDTQITLSLFDMSAGVMNYLASKKYSVPAYGHIQITRVFEDMGLEYDYPEAMAALAVSEDSGTVYAYGSIVDNQKGDATTILPKKQ